MALPEAASADELEPVQARPRRSKTAPRQSPRRSRQEQAPTEQVGDIAAELEAAEETEDAEVTAVLTSVLDRLGAAHHRPFSRS